MPVVDWIGSREDWDNLLKAKISIITQEPNGFWKITKYTSMN